MAVELTKTSETFVGTGALANYTPDIYANASNQIKVYVNGVLKTLGDDYILTGVGSAAGVSVAANFTLGATVLVERVTPITQLVDTQNNETILEDVLDAEFDKLTMIAQEIAQKVDNRALLVPKGETAPQLGSLVGAVEGEVLGWTAGKLGRRPSSAADAAAASASAAAALAARLAAESARDATLTAYDQFDDRYLGPKAADPVVDNDGNALLVGALYYNTVAPEMRIWTGAAWVAAYVSGTGFVAKTGDTMTGKLTTLPASAIGGAGLNLPQGVAPTAPNNGDVWTTAAGMFIRIAGTTFQLAPLDSPTFAGDPKAPTPAAGDNDTSIATTAFVQSEQNPDVSTTASGATITPNGAINGDDGFTVTALAANLTINAPTGAPVAMQPLIIRIKDNGTARTLTWNAIYRIVGTTLPTTTVIGKTLYVGFLYNEADTKWDCVLVRQEA